MIISKSPLRISLGGGATDLPSYYEKYGGFLIAGGINKYVFVSANKQFYDTISLKYSKFEDVKKIDDIEHNLFREALRLVGIDRKIELTSLADVPSGTGLGSSGAFLVALLNTLHCYKGNTPTKRQVAEEACRIELDILKEHEGKQDLYATSFSGIKAYEYHSDGRVSVIPIVNEDIVKQELERNLFLFFTGERRETTASDVLKKQDEDCKIGNDKMMVQLHKIKKIGERTKAAFEDNNFDMFGRFLNEHWKIKRDYSPTTTNDKIDKWYQIALDNGATGGKICGAGGGGGFFMFYHPGTEKEHWKFVETMEESGLHNMEFKFDNDGVTTIEG